MIVVGGEALVDAVQTPDGGVRSTAGGGPFNTARALARLGVPTAFLGRLSTDSRGRELAALLTSDGVSLALATTGPEPTTVALARVDPTGHAEYEFHVEGTSAPNLTPEMLGAGLPASARALHVGTLGLALQPVGSTLTELVRRECGRRLVMLDPNVRPAAVRDPRYRERLEFVIARSTIVKASFEDMAWLYPELAYEQAAERLLEQGVSLVIVTLGEAGAFGATAEGRVHVAAPRLTVVDTIGAGDAFGAAVLARLHDDGALAPDLKLDAGPLRSLLSFACLVASVTCTRAGADPPWRSDLPKATA